MAVEMLHSTFSDVYKIGRKVMACFSPVPVPRSLPEQFQEDIRSIEWESLAREDREAAVDVISRLGTTATQIEALKITEPLGEIWAIDLEKQTEIDTIAQKIKEKTQNISMAFDPAAEETQKVLSYWLQKINALASDLEARVGEEKRTTGVRGDMSVRPNRSIKRTPTNGNMGQGAVAAPRQTGIRRVPTTRTSGGIRRTLTSSK